MYHYFSLYRKNAEQYLIRVWGQGVSEKEAKITAERKATEKFGTNDFEIGTFVEIVSNIKFVEDIAEITLYQVNIK